MSVTVLRGRSGSGKSRYLIEHIKELTLDPLNKVIVITAGSLTFETERSIIRSLGTQGILGLQVFSIQRLAYAILENSVDFMTNADKAVVCKKALMELDDPFHGAAKTPDFINCLSALISKLKDYNQTPESLREINTKDTALKEKLNDTADVLERYQSLCAGRYDAGDMYSLAAIKANEAEFLHGAHVVIDGMDSYSPSVMLLMAKVTELCSDLIIAFRSQGTGSEEDLFASEHKDMLSFIAAAKSVNRQITIVNLDSGNSRYSCEELKFLEGNLFCSPYDTFDKVPCCIQLFEAPSIDTEVEMIASNILSEATSGRRYGDIAIVAGNLPDYIPALKIKFENSGIPYFIDERRTLADNTFFDFLYKSLLCACGDKQSASYYAFCRYSPINELSKYTLRKYMQDYSYKGWHLYSPLRRGENSENAEKVRQAVIKPMQKLEYGLASSSIRLKTQAVRKFLKDCGAEEKLGALCSSLEENGMNAEKEYYSQVIEKTLSVLDGIDEVLGSFYLPAEELIELIKTGCEATKIAIIPPSTDEVGIFDISVARLKNIEVLFAAGVQDGIWPSKKSEPGILSESELQTLFDSGVDLGMNDLCAEKLKIYTALVKPKDKLYVSYNTSSPPSVIIDRIRRIFPNIETKTETPLCIDQLNSPAFLSRISDALSKGDISDSLLSCCAAFLKQPGKKNHAIKVLTRTNSSMPLSTESAVSLYGGIKCSATRIESYYKCPYLHFVSRGLKAKPVIEYVGSALDTGTYIHLALDMFTRRLLNEGKDIKTLDPLEVKETMLMAAEQAATEFDDAKLIEDERFTALFDLLKRELISTALRIRSHFINTEASIFSSEQVFGDYTVSTQFGDVTLSGKIDRIDTAGSYFRVVDYKSSGKTFSINDFASGVSLQLPVYISAAEKLIRQEGKTLYPAGGYYMETGEGYMETEEALASDRRLCGISLNDPAVLRMFSAVNEKGSFTAIDQRLTTAGELNALSKNKYFTAEELNMLLKHTDSLISNAAEGIYGGRTDISPVDAISGSDVCNYCDFKSVCMKDEGFEGNAPRHVFPFGKESLEKCK